MTTETKAGKVFHSLREVKEAFFPNTPLDKLDGEATDEQVREELRRFAENARRRIENISSKKAPR